MPGKFYKDRLSALIQALQEGDVFDHPVDKFDIIETHISYILLTGQFTYKFKKPVNLGFLDFSTLEKRKLYCTEELRLNRRFAPELYLDLVAVTGSDEHPGINGPPPVIEYAVKMKQFPHGAELNYLLTGSRITPDHITGLAHVIAAFHDKAGQAAQTSPYGSMNTIRHEVMDNFSGIRPIISHDKHYKEKVRILEQWTVDKLGELENTFNYRKRQQHIRECHGDLHTGNIVFYDNKLLLFDCIEFSNDLRWIDVMSDIAFLLMDLEFNQKPELAWNFLSEYLLESGDYEGLAVLRFYQIYRAVVRAKIACIRLQQGGMTPVEQQNTVQDYRRHLDLALTYSRSGTPLLIITHGLSGCGKTTLSRSLSQTQGTVRLRSDVERRRIFNKYVDTGSPSPPGTGIYTRESIEHTYQHMVQLAKLILQAGYPLIVDAAFLLISQRKLFRDLADVLHIPFLILDLRADETNLRARIRQRQDSNADASEADLEVLRYQIQTQQPLTNGEKNCRISIDTNQEIDLQQILAGIKNRVENAGLYECCEV